MKSNAKKILKRLNIKCPECDSKKMIVTEDKLNNNGVTYNNKILLCEICGYETPYKKKAGNKFQLIED
jgi:hypothetical protein